jgi:uncharacterized protein (DUF2062 family)
MSKPEPVYTDEMTKKDWAECITSGVTKGIIRGGIFLTILNLVIFMAYGLTIYKSAQDQRMQSLTDRINQQLMR